MKMLILKDYLHFFWPKIPRLLYHNMRYLTEKSQTVLWEDMDPRLLLRPQIIHYPKKKIKQRVVGNIGKISDKVLLMWILII